MRKKILLVAVIVISAIHLSAQVKKNEIYLGISGEKKFGQISTIGVRPSVFVGLSNHSTVGVYFDYTDFKNARYPDGTKWDTKSSGLGLIYNYYHYIGKNQKFGAYASADISLSRIRIIGMSGGLPSNYEYNQSKLSISPGLFYKPVENMMITLSPGGIDFSQTKFSSLYTRNSFGKQISIGLSFGIGSFSKKKMEAKSTY
jgi:hypothetical protein